MKTHREWPREHPRLGRHSIWIKEVEVAERRRQIRAARRAENARRTRAGQEMSAALVRKSSAEAAEFHQWCWSSAISWVDFLFLTGARNRFVSCLRRRYRLLNRSEIRGAAVGQWKHELHEQRAAMLGLKRATRSDLFRLV